MNFLKQPAINSRNDLEVSFTVVLCGGPFKLPTSSLNTLNTAKDQALRTVAGGIRETQEMKIGRRQRNGPTLFRLLLYCLWHTLCVLLLSSLPGWKRRHGDEKGRGNEAWRVESIQAWGMRLTAGIVISRRTDHPLVVHRSSTDRHHRHRRRHCHYRRRTVRAMDWFPTFVKINQANADRYCPFAYRSQQFAVYYSDTRRRLMRRTCVGWKSVQIPGRSTF